jgi:hypothetical protein
VELATVYRLSGAWMGGVVNPQQLGAIDFRIDLGCRERRVAEQLLDLAKISAG